VRLTERHLHDDPPTTRQIADARRDIEHAMDTVSGDVQLTEAASLIGLAGSVTTVTAIAMGLQEYDANRIHHARISATAVHEVTQRLLEMTRTQRAAIGVMHPGRVDVIGAGALVLDTIVQRLGFHDVIASEHDILDGIALSAADASGDAG
jgi:exopolyphosphatase / guanosine-5'-triphosphate,3'-diphosphate pyrophosphatase